MRATSLAPGKPREIRGEPTPIQEARRLLHRAARLPFEAANPRDWADHFTNDIVAARRALVDHILQAERVDSDLNEVYACSPRLRPLVERQTEEHRELLALCHDLAEEAMVLESPGLWVMVEFSERTKALELLVEKHQERRMDLVYESAYRELGGEAG